MVRRSRAMAGKWFRKNEIKELWPKLLPNSKIYVVWLDSAVMETGPKCPHCNRNRQLVHTFPNGQTSVLSCECGKLRHVSEARCEEGSVVGLIWSSDKHGKFSIGVEVVRASNRGWSEMYDLQTKFRASLLKNPDANYCYLSQTEAEKHRDALQSLCENDA